VRGIQKWDTIFGIEKKPHHHSRLPWGEDDYYDSFWGCRWCHFRRRIRIVWGWCQDGHLEMSGRQCGCGL
jgi:hypothetical protein